MCLAAVVASVASVAGCGSGSSGSPAAIDKAPLPRGATDVERRFVEVVRAVSPAVVQIETSDGLGSGVVYDGRRNIVTNAHVVGGHKTFTVTLSGSDHHQAKLVGTYPASDLAVIRLDSGSPPPARFGDSAKLQPGEFSLAIGNPLGLRSSVTEGIVSSLGRTVGEGNGAVISSAIQTSAPINPGNSGGALVNIAGEVIGVPTLAATDPELGGAQAPGIGFAIPSNTVKRIADQLIASGRVTRSGRAFLGIEVATTVLAPGVVISAVERGGPADRAGLRAGDVILAVDGKPTRTTDELATVLAGLRPGQTVRVTVLHPDGSRATVSVRLGEARA